MNSQTQTLTLIVAIDNQWGIGICNTMPWYLPEDLAYFKQTTLNKSILMGRKTFESIGSKPLPQRQNIVITRNPNWKHDGVDVSCSIEDALKSAQSKNVFVIGGAQIYRQAFRLADTLLVTQIYHTFKCDAFFPEINSLQWQEISRIPKHSAKPKLDFAFVRYQRIAE